jgi:DNA polymerase-1
MPTRVEGWGDPKADIVIVGEAPGETEVDRGIPFCGRSGLHLDNLLGIGGMARTSGMYLTNVVKERPPYNDISKFITFNGTEATTTIEYNLYKEELLAELAAIPAKVIVPVGKVALYALTGYTDITKRRGSILWSDTLNKKVIPTLHPAYALRDPIQSYVIASDMRRIGKQAKFSNILDPTWEVYTRPPFSLVMEFLTDITSGNLTHAYDIEVLNQQLSCISFAIANGTLTVGMSIPFCEKGEHYFTADEELQILHRIGMILQSETPSIAHHTWFDSTFLFNLYGIITNELGDTMVAQGILCPDMPKGLDFITSLYTEIPYYKDDGKRFMAGLDGDEESFWNYNALDSIACLKCHKKLLEELETHDLLNTYQRQLNLIKPLTFMQSHGLRIDVEAKEKASRQADEELKELQATLESQVGQEINPNSSKQVMAYFYDKKGITPYKNRKTGKATVDNKALTRLKIRGFDEAATLLEIRALSKLKGTYYDMILDSDNRIRSSYNPVGTKTGRLSSSKTLWGTGGNLQNLPKSFSKHVLADEGHVMYQMDLSQAENRIVAYLGPIPEMIEVFESGTDLHTKTASLIFNKPMGQISTKDGMNSSSIGNGQRCERYWGKTANHALNYGMGPNTLAVYAEIPQTQAKMIWERYHHAYPGVQNSFHAGVKDQIYNGRKLTNLMGRTRYFLGRIDDGLLNEAYNFGPQSLVADLINQEGLTNTYYNQSRVILLNQVHDSIWIQIPLTVDWIKHSIILSDIKNALEKELIAPNGVRFKLPVDVEVGASYGTLQSVKSLLPENLRDAYKESERRLVDGSVTV